MAGLSWVVVLLLAGHLGAKRGWYIFSATCFLAAGVTGANTDFGQTVAATLQQVLAAFWGAIVTALNGVVR